MGTLTALSLVLLARGLSMEPPGLKDGSGVNQASMGATTMVALMAFDVNDQIVTLRYRIMNRSDHDIWVCEGIGLANKPSSGDYEVYVHSDARSLVIAKRIEAPMEVTYVRLPSFEGRYVRVRPGQEQIQSVSLAIAVKRYTLFTSSGPDVEYATRLLLKVGFYDRDLAGGQNTDNVSIPYGRTTYPTGDERCVEIAIDGVFIKVVPLNVSMRRRGVS